jgi:hypothetical protein
MLLFRNYRVKRVLKEARRLIEEEGWTQGAFHNSRGYCLVGAVEEATGYSDFGGEVVWELDLQLGDNVLYWNDKPGRTKEEVVSLLDRTIEKL